MKVGDYVRTKYGEIARIDEYLGKDKVYKNMEHYETDRMVTKFNNFILYKEDIIKSNKNIIDLIKDGDYVNGECVINVDSIEVYTRDGMYLNEDIKSIVTKEQFEQMEYKIGDENE